MGRGHAVSCTLLESDMPVSPVLTTKIHAGQVYFRITPPDFFQSTTNPVDYAKVVNGKGSVNSKKGARYNYPGALTVYLTENLNTCLAERMFYFHKEVLNGLDILHHVGVVPDFTKAFALWAIKFRQDVSDILDVNVPGALSFFNIFPALVLNPSQDYEHLKDRRAAVQNAGYKGLQVPSVRDKNKENLVVLFEDQSNNIQTITPYEVEFRLITPGGSSFSSHASDELDYTAGEVRILSKSMSMPYWGSSYINWRRVEFNH
jgi:RES domain-containing protein